MTDRARAIELLRRAGLMAAEEEADDLIAAARSPEELTSMLARRSGGEPTAWITGQVSFLGLPVRVDPGVYVPRWQTQAVALHALAHLPAGGTAVDLCTGSGAVGAFLAASRPAARVIATDIDPRAVRCAGRNGIEALVGDLFDPLPAGLQRKADLVVAVAPYVPDGMVAFLPRDVIAHEPVHALRGGGDGLSFVARIVGGCVDWLRPGGSLVVEVGADQVEPVRALLVEAGLDVHDVLRDGDGDRCGICGSTNG